MDLIQTVKSPARCDTYLLTVSTFGCAGVAGSRGRHSVTISCLGLLSLLFNAKYNSKFTIFVFVEHSSILSISSKIDGNHGSGPMCPVSSGCLSSVADGAFGFRSQEQGRELRADMIDMGGTADMPGWQL